MVEGLQEEVEEEGEEEEEDIRLGDARLERRAQRQRGEGHDHHRLGCRSISQVPPRGHWSEDTGSRRQEDHVQGEERVHAVDELLTLGRDQGPCISEQHLQTEVGFDAEGSDIENKASGQRRPCVMRVDSGVLVIDVRQRPDRLRRPNFCGAGRVKVTR